MKLKEFSKLFNGLDPELEVGIFGPEYFNTNLKIEILNGLVTDEGIEYSKREYSDTIKIIDIGLGKGSKAVMLYPPEAFP